MFSFDRFLRHDLIKILWLNIEGEVSGKVYTVQTDISGLVVNYVFNLMLR
jgi:hypothetical protein